MPAGNTEKKKATAQLRPCLVILQGQWGQNLWASPKSSLFPPSSNTWECCWTGGTEQQDPPLFTHSQNHQQLLLWYCFALQEKAVCSNFHHLAFTDFCLVVKQTSQHCEKWEGVPQEE